jgi:uncharacterized protein YkwD
MKRWSLLLIIGLILTACQAASTPTPEPTVTDEPTAAPTPTTAPTFTPAPPTPVPADTATPAPTATPVPNDIWVSAPNGLNLRAEANATAKLLVTLKDKQHLVVVGPPVGPDGGGVTWQNARTDDNLTGFASAQFLTTTNPTAPVATPIVPAATPPAPAITSTVAANVTGEVYVTAPEGLNLRAQANTTSSVIAIVALAQHLTALGAPVGPDASGITWQGVRTDDGKSGYVAAQFVSTTKPAATSPTITATLTAAATPIAPTATVPVTPVATTSGVWVIATGGLFLRAQPSPTGAVVAALNYGQHLTALAARSAPDAGGISWQNVRTDSNQTGYAAADFLSASAPVTATPTVSPTTPITATATPTTTAQIAAQSVVQIASESALRNVPLSVNPGSTGVAVELFQRINTLRAQNGLNQLAWNDQLAAAALRHNQDMAATGNVSHTGSDGSLEQDRVKTAGYAALASDEVIYASVNGLEPVWQFWSTHHIHYLVLVSTRFTEMGISAYTAGAMTYYTADFGKP